MNNHDEILSKLRDIHEPLAPSWWPPAPGYYVFLLLAVLTFGLIFIYFYGRSRRAIKKAIFQEWLMVEADFKMHNDAARLQSATSALLKRIIFLKVKSADKSADLAALKPTWIKIWPRGQELISLLEHDRYKKDPKLDTTKLLDIARRQIKRCRI